MWLGPFTRDLSPERDLFVLVQLFDLLKCWRVLSDESTLLEERKNVCQFFLVRKLLDIAQELSLRDPSQRVLDPKRETRKSPTQAMTTTVYGPCRDVRRSTRLPFSASSWDERLFCSVRPWRAKKGRRAKVPEGSAPALYFSEGAIVKQFNVHLHMTPQGFRVRHAVLQERNPQRSA